MKTTKHYDYDIVIEGPAALSATWSKAIKIQYRWLGLEDDEWDKELKIINELSIEDFLDFVKADFGMLNVIRIAAHHPKLAIRQLFDMIKNARSDTNNIQEN